MWAFYIPSMACVLVAVILVLRKYASPRVPLLVRLIAGVGWFTSISIIAIVPIDVWTTLNGGDNSSVFIMWKICYWATQLLTWFMIPFSQGFDDAGDFTILGRVLSSLKHNLTYYLSIAVAGVIGIGLLLISGRLHTSDLLPLAMLLSNTYGLVAVMLLLGFGLVRIPRSMLQEADPAARLAYAHHKHWAEAYPAMARVGRAAEKLQDAAAEMALVATVVEATSQPMARRDPLRKHMDLIYQEAVSGSPIKPSQAARDERGRVNLDELTDADLDYGTDERSLAQLRRRLKRAIYTYEGLLAEYVNEVRVAMDLDVIVKCRLSRDYSLGISAEGGARRRLKTAWRIYRCTAKPWVTRGVACCLGVVSFLIVWSEATIASGTHPDLSPFSHMVNAGEEGEAMTQLLSALPLAYMAAACYYSLFQLGMFSFYHVVPHATNAHSLLMNAAQVTRFAAPLAYNYLHVIRMQEYLGSDRATVFAQEMGTAMHDVPVFGTDFNTWFPLVVVVYCTLLFLNVWDSLARLCIPKRYRFDVDEGSDDNTERGRLLLRQEQDAQAQGLQIGDCLGLWGDSEAPARGNAADASRSRTPGQARGAAAEAGLGSRAHNTEMSKAMDTPAPGSLPWPSSSQKYGSSGGTAGLGALGGGTAGRPELAAGQTSPGSGRSLLRNNYASSSNSLTSAEPGGHGGLDDVFARMQNRTQEHVSNLEKEETSMLGSKGDWSAADPRTPWGRSWGKR